MRFLRHWPAFNTPPSPQTLLDIAIAIALLPHLFILKTPMLLFMLLSLLLISRGKPSKRVTLLVTLAGIVAIALSFFAEYNFASFSRLLVFISFLITLLLFAIILQRLSGTINFYLLISPALLLTLSFFYFNTLSMLFYSLGALFSLVVLLLWQRMQASLREALRYSSMLFLFSLPIVALLFMVFPRISFQKTDFGFKGETIKRTGHDGTMHLDEKALLVPSQKVVMEVLFDGEIPADESLYFRGSALYLDRTTTWESLPVYRRHKASRQVRLAAAKNIVSYRITLYPHQNRWLYMLDMPLEKPEKSYLDPDMMVTAHENVDEIRRYNGRSALEYDLELDDSAIFVEEALESFPGRDPEIAGAVTSLVSEEDHDLIKADRIYAYFRSLDLTYTLRPKRLDLDHPVDAFLYETKTGYCVHFASAFATAARMAGIPARIITGFKAERSRAVNNYLVVVEADAHAWVELYIEGFGWKRYEPTAAAAHIDIPSMEAVARESGEHSLMRKLNLHIMYTKYLIETWVLEYSRSKQMTLLKRLLEDGYFLLKFAAMTLLFLFSSALLFIVLKRARCQEPVMCAMEPLLHFLEKKGLKREAGETMRTYLQRAPSIIGNEESLEMIGRLYDEIRYSRHADRAELSRLRKAISELQRSGL